MNAGLVDLFGQLIVWGKKEKSDGRIFTQQL